MNTPKSTGKTDANYHTLYIGDTVRDRHTGLVFNIDKYGQLISEQGKLVRRDWNGNDYLFVAALKEAVAAREASEMPETPAAVQTAATGQKTKKDKRGGRHFPEGSKFVLVNGKRKLVRPGDPMPEQAPAEDALSKVSDAELAKELRRRGYTVEATKQIAL